MRLKKSYVSCIFDNISIHAPAKGATLLCLSLHCMQVYFNPRTREGCDTAVATILIPLIIFQSTHPRRVRRSGELESQIIMAFQSTHPRRVRRFDESVKSYERYFNPRTREGCDVFRSSAYPNKKRFQSTHPRRVRPVKPEYSVRELLFQSTHPRRVRHRITKD